MTKRILVLLLVVVLLAAVPVFAAEGVKEQNAGTKLARGFTNLIGCWLELPKQVILVSKDENLFHGLTYGFVKGIGMGFFRLADGAFETVSCVIPPYDKVLVEPEFVFEGW
jgi:putative exosortase-associated protein (TIGR04073 family)